MARPDQMPTSKPEPEPEPAWPSDPGSVRDSGTIPDHSQSGFGRALRSSEPLPLLLSLASLGTSVASFLGFVITSSIGWRKEKRERQQAEVELEKRKLEVEKLRIEVDKLRQDNRNS